MSAVGEGPMKILVVDDEAPLVHLIEQYLIRDGFRVVATGDGSHAVDIVREQSPAVVILDLGLPGLDGVEACRQIRTFSDCYIIMLTARAEEVDRLIGLSVGADDYVTKPFSPRELVLRVKAMLRRPRNASGSDLVTYQLGDLRVDLAGREVQLRGQLVDLTLTEFELLATLLAEPGVAQSRSALITKVWGDEWFGDKHLVDVHIGHLRRKLGDDSANPRFIHTVRGIGYKTGPPR
ncbi:response regulator transcription factor [Nesterenkonia sp. LB17]|uniref:response regulator transcription factor n=1 Tax=unclassified Nesterenkonia TaxID=2629769 RepID=UPI001F4C8900|nr:MULTISPECIES: response regulator transcription factor [unclassified Nesterenkonia]MCH8560760.1 response regulator transcription factor [Nesterenkonia sp. DZ6]MCH8563631.1 response regulator transcription factor [Nesterenkonia sp. YGD6]MCH8566279.1 response regulator transcription factor [Nesterenkonia sp. LB17]MCH8570842.1 response regulator transcription factor [Nesterenkonia sp. AY15]